MISGKSKFQKRIEIHRNNKHREVRVYDVDNLPEKSRISKKNSTIADFDKIEEMYRSLPFSAAFRKGLLTTLKHDLY